MKKTIISILIIVQLVGCSDSFSNKDTVTLIAHRGAKDAAPEHTLSAYEKAIELEADYIEIDLRMSRDGHLIAFHDETLESTTNGKGEVSEFTLEEIKTLDAGSWFGKEYEGEKIPTLQEIFEEFGDETKYYIETRLVDNTTIMEEKLVNLIDENDLLDRVIIQSFSADSLKEIHRIKDSIPLIQLVFEDNLDNLSVKEIKEYAVGVGPYARQIDEEFVKRVQASGLVVHVWFDQSNELELMEEVISYGVDGVFTDHLNNTIEVINQNDQETRHSL